MTEDHIVQVGSRVRVRDAIGREVVVTIRDDQTPVIRSDSSLGRALMGHHVGDGITVPAERGMPERRLTVVAIH